MKLVKNIWNSLAVVDGIGKRMKAKLNFELEMQNTQA